MPAKLVATMTLTLALLFGLMFGLVAVAGIYLQLNGILVVGLAFGMVVLQWYIGPLIIKWTTNMSPMERKNHEWIMEYVESLCKKHRLKVPKMFVVNSAGPNAFVFGRTNSSANLCVTRGLLSKLNKEEVKGVLAHEVAHIKQNDMVIMVTVSAIPVLAFFVARFLLFAPAGGEKRDLGYLILVGVAAWAIYFITNLLILYFSRIREYYADRFAAVNHNPRDLAKALSKITYGLSLEKKDSSGSAARSFFIADPYTSHFEVAHFSKEYSDMNITNDEVKKAMEWEKKNTFAKISEIFRTHPLTWKRIRALHEMKN